MGVNRPLLLDLYCCQGGASRGYIDAGWDVVGNDMLPQRRYPYPIHVGDALQVLHELNEGRGVDFGARRIYLSDISAAHASPPCQAHTKAWKIQKREHPRLIAPTREGLEALGVPYIIENVEDARPELREPVMLCGAMFGIETYRHRLFESNVALAVPDHPEHLHRLTKMGRRPVDGEYMHIVGNFTDPERARRIMGMPWASRDGLREAIPPVYTEVLGRQLLEAIR